MNKVILRKIKRAILLNLEEVAYSTLSSYGTYLSKKDYKSIIGNMNKMQKYHGRVIKYIYYESVYRDEFDKSFIGRGVLCKSICFGWADSLRLLLADYGPDTPNIVDGLDIWACIGMVMAEACNRGHTEIVRILLDDGRVNLQWMNHLAIRNACRAGHVDIVRMLLADSRVYPCAANTESIRVASANGHTSIVRMLLQDTRTREDGRSDPGADNNEAIRSASENNRIEIVRLLLDDERVDPRALDSHALNHAAQHGRIEIVRILLEDGRSDPCVRGSEMISIACAYGHVEIVRLLLEDSRVDPSVNHNIAIRAAVRNICVRNICIEIVRILLKDERVVKAGLAEALQDAKDISTISVNLIMEAIKNSV